jgi:hypothetical protein
MATEKWIAGSGVGLTWTQLFGTNAAELASLANGSAVLDNSGDIANDTAKDIYADLSVILGSATTTAPNKIDVFFYPLGGDGVTYGDGTFVAGTAKAATPGPEFFVGSLALQLGASSPLVGMVQRLVLPPGKGRFVIMNNAGVAFPSTFTAGVYYRTYNRSVA